MADDESPQQTEGAALIVLDGDPAERERIEAMAEELGVEIWAASPGDLVPERSDTWESLSQARAVVVAAQFGPRSGLEILEALRWEDGTASQVRALGLDRPTRAWIEAALRAGATTCVMRPLDPAELQSKVIAASDAAGAAGDEEPDAAVGEGAAETATDADGDAPDADGDA